jgi:predicted 2-oxoglutarate/Fe(II)-dependent dioxygenase YbiX
MLVMLLAVRNEMDALTIFNLELKPKPGTLVVFPGTLKYLHGVRAVTKGMRHTIASFLTFDASKEYRF